MNCLWKVQIVYLSIFPQLRTVLWKFVGGQFATLFRPHLVDFPLLMSHVNVYPDHVYWSRDVVTLYVRGRVKYTILQVRLMYVHGKAQTFYKIYQQVLHETKKIREGGGRGT